MKKLEKITSKKALAQGQAVTLGVVGGMASKAGVGFIPEEYRTSLAKAGVAVAAIIGAVAIPNESIKAMLVGTALVQGTEAISEEVKKHVTVDANATGGQKVLQDALGLNGGRRSYKSLGNGTPIINWNAPVVEAASSSFDLESAS